ncbi:MAG: nucleotidyltransferase domain-containing protein [Micrococcales bacterium]|nr:nucleotidyltransferase domain-containing protein [Micrococcales bacterium]
MNRKRPGTYAASIDPPQPDTAQPLLAPSLVESRTYLCEVLDALAAHIDGLVLIGSHAVHERTKHVQVDSTSTKDSDLAVVPSMVSTQPSIDEAMRRAGFRPLGELEGSGTRYEHQPGLWGKGFNADGFPVAEVDLIVPMAMSGGGRRAPRSMSAHGPRTTRTAPGIELAAVDRDLLPVESFTDGSVRDAWICGPTALLCAKSFKLAERVAERDTLRPDGAPARNRVSAKDAGDMWRVMAASDPAEVADTFARLQADKTAGGAATVGLDHLRSLIASGELRRLSLLDLHGKTDTDDTIDHVYHTWTERFLAS